MMKRARRNHSAAFEAKVALDVIKGERTSAKHLEQIDVHPGQTRRGGSYTPDCDGDSLQSGRTESLER
jgi:hypothetical protein